MTNQVRVKHSPAENMGLLRHAANRWLCPQRCLGIPCVPSRRCTGRFSRHGSEVRDISHDTYTQPWHRTSGRDILESNARLLLRRQGPSSGAQARHQALRDFPSRDHLGTGETEPKMSQLLVQGYSIAPGRSCLPSHASARFHVYPISPPSFQQIPDGDGLRQQRDLMTHQTAESMAQHLRPHVALRYYLPRQPRIQEYNDRSDPEYIRIAQYRAAVSTTGSNDKGQNKAVFHSENDK